MGRVFLNDNATNVSDQNLRAWVQATLQDLTDQLNSGATVASLTRGNKGKIPVGLRSGDFVVDIQEGDIKIGAYNGKQVVYANLSALAGAISAGQHGNLPGGTLHANATSTTAGFKSAADRLKSNHSQGTTTSAAPASTTEYPSDQDWGFHIDSTDPTTVKLIYNHGGTIKSIALV